MTTNTVQIRIGGLYRCCIETARRRGEGLEGERLTCTYCQKPTLLFIGGAWEWSKEA